MKILENISETDYRALPLESYSSLKNILTSPNAFLYYKKNPFKGSPATLLGTSIHHYLQGNRHLVAFSIIDKRKKEEYAKFVEEFKALAGDEGIIVPASFQVTLDKIMQNVNESKSVQQLLQDIQIEVPVQAEYKGLQYKAKVDGLGGGYVLEIKSSSQAVTRAQFAEEAIDRHYDLQAFLYLHATNRSFHYFIVVNTTAPFKVIAYRTSPETIASGKEKADKIVYLYNKHIVGGEIYEDSDIEEV